MNNWEVVRIGICYCCGNEAKMYLGEYEAENEQEAIDRAIEMWGHGNFGEAGAIRQDDITKENAFMDAEFKAEIIHEE